MGKLDSSPVRDERKIEQISAVPDGTFPLERPNPELKLWAIFKLIRYRLGVMGAGEIWIKMLVFSGLNGVFRVILAVFDRLEKCSKIFQKMVDASLRLCQSEDTHGN
jgi:hypothetical protein